MNADVGLRIEESEKLFALDMSEQMGQCPTVQLCIFFRRFLFSHSTHGPLRPS